MTLRLAHGLALLAALVAVRAQAALVTDFAASYALYSACVGNAADFDSDLDIDGVDFLMWQRGMGKNGLFITSSGDANRDGVVGTPDFSLWKSQLGGAAPVADSVCFKLYFDPQGIVNGSVTVVIDAPNPLPGQSRFMTSGDNGIADANPNYVVAASAPVITVTPNGQRLTSKVSFIARNPFNPPLGQITLFGYQAEDRLPQLGLANVQARFEFQTGDFIRVRESTTGDFTVFESTQLNTVVLPFVGQLALMVDEVGGKLSIVNQSSIPVNLNHYEITSAAGSLNPTGWVSLADMGLGFQEELPTSPFRLAETAGTGSGFLAPGMRFELSSAFNSVVGVRDLRFVYSVFESALVPGMVKYVPLTSTSVPEPLAEPMLLASVIAAACARRRLMPVVR